MTHAVTIIHEYANFIETEMNGTIFRLLASETLSDLQIQTW